MRHIHAPSSFVHARGRWTTQQTNFPAVYTGWLNTLLLLLLALSTSLSPGVQQVVVVVCVRYTLPGQTMSSPSVFPPDQHELTRHSIIHRRFFILEGTRSLNLALFPLSPYCDTIVVVAMHAAAREEGINNSTPELYTRDVLMNHSTSYVAIQQGKVTHFC